MFGITTSAQEQTMTSLDLLEVINQYRVAAGKGKMRHDNFMVKIREEFGDAAPEFSGTAFYTNGTGGQVETSCFNLNQMRALRMGMRESSDVRGQVCDWIENRLRQEVKPMTHLQVLAQVAAGLADVEQRQFEHQQALEEQQRIAEKQQRELEAKADKSEVERLSHKVDSRGCLEGYILISDACRKYKRGLSKSVFKEVLAAMNVPMEGIYITLEGGVTSQTNQVHEERTREAIDTFYTGIERTSKTRYSHALFGDKKFQA